jgi:osmotically inducible protein OsmC
MAASTGSATWTGDLRDGSGELIVGPGRWKAPFSFRSRFGDTQDDGTNPEELLAAAHAGCFSMGLVHALTEAGHCPRSVETRGRAHLRPVDGVPTISLIELDTIVDVDGIDEAAVREHAEQAKVTCALSRALAGVAEIRLTARLAG